MIIGIDPSFSSTGVAVLDDSGELQKYKTVKCPGKCFSELGLINSAAHSITKQILEFIGESRSDVVIEVPAPNKAGVVLSILHGWLVSTLSRYHNVYFVSCLACDSFIGNKLHSKSYIVQYCKNNKWAPNVRINNDVCTSIVLAKILIEYFRGNYKNTLTKFTEG